jgi:hypothetical protein
LTRLLAPELFGKALKQSAVRLVLQVLRNNEFCIPAVAANFAHRPVMKNGSAYAATLLNFLSGCAYGLWRLFRCLLGLCEATATFCGGPPSNVDHAALNGMCSRIR